MSASCAPSGQLDHGKRKALLEFCHALAKSRGFEGPPATSAVEAAAAYVFPMISAIFDQTLISPENPFDEAEFAVQENSPPVLHQQLRKAEAKAGDEFEVLKFLAALAYEFRISQVLKVPRLCEKMNKMAQMEMAHVFSFMGDAVRAADPNWWKVLQLPYDDSELNNLGRQILIQATTPLRTPSRGKSNRPLFDSPVAKVVDSPSGREHLALEYERRIKNEKAHNEELNGLLVATSNENSELREEVSRLKAKLDELKAQKKGCGQECPNLDEVARQRIRLHVLENQVRTKTADLQTLKDDFEEARANESALRVSNAELAEKNELLATERERLSQRLSYLLDINDKHQALQQECENLRLRLSLQASGGPEVEKLRQENEDLFKRLQTAGDEATKKTARLAELEKTVVEQKQEVAALRRQAAAPSDELQAAQSQLKAMGNENSRLQQRVRELEEERAREASKENRQPVEGGASKAELAPLRDNLKQLAENLAAAKKEAKEWAEKCEDQRVRADGLQGELNEAKRQQKSTVQNGRRVERGPSESSAFAHSAAASSLKSNGARYPNSHPDRTPKRAQMAGGEFRDEDRSHILKERNERSLPHMKSSLIDNKVVLG
ncbi:hypothetical protein M3Y99_00183200 [Aphelenchoides fujianensis]|nr:hypothetical protein M3Y99_00183200 [Aphelenchoides fujianensis]